MLKIERRIAAFLERNIFWIFFAVTACASLAMRLFLFPVHSADMEQFLLPWIREIIAGGGLRALATHSANYNTAYLFLLYLASLLPLDPVYAVKLFSVLGDYLLALCAALLLYRRDGNIKRALAGFLLVALLPTSIINSSYWGQCDSIYTAFLMLAVHQTTRLRWTAHLRWATAFVFFGAALCFKLQAIFLLPFFIILYCLKKEFSALLFFIPPAMLFLSTAPASLFGGGLFRGFSIYVGQVRGEQSLSVNYHNVSVFFSGYEYNYFGPLLIVATLLICFAMCAVVLHKKPRFSQDGMLLLAAWSAMTYVLFLPGMHERYGYPGEIFMVVWFLCSPSLRRLIPTATFYCIGFMACSRFLFGVWPENNAFIALVNVANWCFVTHTLLRNQPREAHNMVNQL